MMSYFLCLQFLHNITGIFFTFLINRAKMMSVGDSGLFQTASDEIYDHVCGSRKISGINKGSKHYCQDWKEQLCDACKDYHRIFAITKNHKVVTGSQFSSFANKNAGPRIICVCKLL